ncbi:MAG: hypothetical protein EOM06_11010 [Sphingobacteriia bacterium]|nr:hypothetical protein [Sphingobacteriia bacterium]
MKSKPKFSSFLLIILFIIIVTSAFVQDNLKIIPPGTNTENRKLTDKPELDVTLLDPFPVKYENYYNDHFAFRNYFVNLYSDISLNLFRKCPFPDQVLIGTNDDLYAVRLELDTYLRKSLFRRGEIERMRSDFTYRKEYLAKKGIDYYVVICPTKYSVYPEFLPWYIKPLDTISHTDQFINLLKEIDIRVVDLRKSLTAAKESIPQQLFRKTDNHWNNLGSFVAYRSIMEQIVKDHPEIKPLTFSDFTIIPEETVGGNLAFMINKKYEMKDVDYIFKPNFSLDVDTVRENPYPAPSDFDPGEFFRSFYLSDTNNLPKVVFFHDSFTLSLQQFLKYSFSGSVFIWDKWEYKLNEPIVENEKPDIYVTIVLESLLGGLCDNCVYK